MQFYKQTAANTCHLIAIKTLLTHFEIYLSNREIKALLPKHGFGNYPSEIGVYLESLGLKTKLYLNQQKSAIKEASLLTSIGEYEKIGRLIEEAPTPEVVTKKPILINVDYHKIAGRVNRPCGHFVVLLKEQDILWLYDGSNQNDRIQTTFEFVYKASVEINRYKHNGAWLCL